jgi:hypothetical protein
MSNFVSLYGGNKDTMRHSGMKGVRNALAAGLTINQIRDQAAREGVTFGVGATEYLAARSPDLFISKYGGNEDTMANSGMNAVSRALAAGMSAADIDSTASREGVTFGVNARNFLNQQANQKKFYDDMRGQFDKQMKNITNQMTQQQQAYQDSMQKMTNTLQATMNPNTRESVLGVKGAGNDSSNTAKLNRQGMKGSFARTGLRIKSLNI